VVRLSSHHRSSRRYQLLREQFKQDCWAEDARCWLCPFPIDYSAGQYEEDAFELDHYYPVSTHPELAEDPSNFRASHRRCNQVRGNAPPVVEVDRTSEDWFAGFGK